MERFIVIDNKIYSLKFGLKSLIQLRQFSNNITRQEKCKFMFFLAMKNNSLSDNDMEILYQHLITDKGFDYVEKLLFEVLDLSINNSVPTDLSFDIEELYCKGVGEMGIAPHIFYEMSPYEITIAYKGYLERKQFEANCILVAIRKSKSKKASLLNLLTNNDEYVISSVEKREEEFKALNI